MVLGAIICIVSIALGLLFGASLVQAAHMQKMDRKEQLTFTENTMWKVYNALQHVGLTRDEATRAVSSMQNSGILFRETPKE